MKELGVDTSEVEVKKRKECLTTAGEEIIIPRSGQPVARPAPIDETPPVFGVDEGRFVVPDDFDDPLDDELLRAFEGRD